MNHPSWKAFNWHGYNYLWCANWYSHSNWIVCETLSNHCLALGFKFNLCDPLHNLCGRFTMPDLNRTISFASWNSTVDFYSKRLSARCWFRVMEYKGAWYSTYLKMFFPFSKKDHEGCSFRVFAVKQWNVVTRGNLFCFGTNNMSSSTPQNQASSLKGFD